MKNLQEILAQLEQQEAALVQAFAINKEQREFIQSLIRKEHVARVIGKSLVADKLGLTVTKEEDGELTTIGHLIDVISQANKPVSIARILKEFRHRKLRITASEIVTELMIGINKGVFVRETHGELERWRLHYPKQEIVEEEVVTYVDHVRPNTGICQAVVDLVEDFPAGEHFTAQDLAEKLHYQFPKADVRAFSNVLALVTREKRAKIKRAKQGVYCKVD